MGFAGCRRWHGSPLGRAAPCPSVGGYMRGKKRKATKERKATGGGRALRRPKRLRQCGSPTKAAIRLGRFRVFRPPPAALGFRGGFCVAVSRFLAKPIQNGFCGIRPPAREPAGACPALRVGRWVYEKALWGGRPAQLGAPTRQPSRASTVPIHQSPLLRGALRSAGVLTIAARTTTVGSAASGPEPTPRRATVKNPEGAREHPDRAEGWALWVTGGSPHLPQSHRGYRRVGEAAQQPSLHVRASSWGA